MDIRLYNSWSGKIETLTPIVKGHVSMYVCGPTVYDYVHIGNLRPVVVFDVLRRLLEYLGYQVTYVSNYTDIDDKIINKAFAEDRSEREIADFYIAAYEDNVKKINSLLPTHTPRVTSYIEQIIAYIQSLLDKGAAYEVDGEVFFKVASIPEYAHLSNMKLDELVTGARVDQSPKKTSPLDFVLWKQTDKGLTYDSPWGKGRPGWHTECAVMIDTLFPSKIIDIHGGGFDLKFPHHDNEIAQSMAQNGTRLANIWMHNGFINLNDDKMSKSTGNLMRANDALSQFGGPALRLMLLSTHYRLPVNLTDAFLVNANAEIAKLTTAMKQLAVSCNWPIAISMPSNPS
jgi:cysteinyl-tRNA synthetase